MVSKESIETFRWKTE